jgi:hypothetical protein
MYMTKLAQKRLIIGLIIVVLVLAIGGLVWARYQDPIANVPTPTGWRKLPTGELTLYQNESAGKWYSLAAILPKYCAGGSLEERLTLVWDGTLPEEANVKFIFSDSITQATWQQPGASGLEQHWCFTKKGRARSVEMVTLVSDVTTRELLASQIVPSLFK